MVGPQWSISTVIDNCTTSAGWQAAKQRSLETNRRKKESVIAAYNTIPNTCGNCAAPLAYEKRKNTYCSSSCAAIINNTKHPKRKAAIDTPVRTRRQYGKKRVYQIICSGCSTEFNSTKPTRKYCTVGCKSASIKRDLITAFKNGVVVNHRAARRILIELVGSNCSLCNWSAINPKSQKCPIELDHIDGNPNNTVISNVRLLCPNCHSIQPTYKALNKGNGRFSRLERYRTGQSY